MKKVCFPFTGTLVGGSYESTALLIRELQANEGLYPLVFLPTVGPNTATFRRNNVKTDYYSLSDKCIIRLRKKFGLSNIGCHHRVYRMALSILRSECPDIVHINDDRTMLSWGRAAHTLEIPVVWHVRQVQGNYLMDNLRSRWSTSKIIISGDCAGRFRFRKPGRLTKIPNAVDMMRFDQLPSREVAKTTLGIPKDGLCLSFVGNFTTAKRPEWAVASLKAILDGGIDSYLLMAGEDFSGGKISRMVSTQARRLGVEDRVMILGYREDIPAILAASDIALMPSIREPFGRVVIEAMAAGATVVATRAGGVPEIIEDGRDGFLANPNDLNDFCAEVIKVAKNDSIRVKAASLAKKKVRENFGPEPVAEAVSKLYGQILENPPPKMTQN